MSGPAGALDERSSTGRRRRIVARVALSAAAVAVALTAAAWAGGVRFNSTPSIPRGLYLASAFDPATAERGDLVVACPSAEAAEAMGRHLARGPCPGGVVELGKPLAGLPGDTVVVDSASVRVGGVPLPSSAPLFRDRSGHPIRPRLGPHVLGAGEYWLHAGRVPTSVDSRYLGPVRDVREALRPLLVEREVRQRADLAE